MTYRLGQSFGPPTLRETGLPPLADLYGAPTRTQWMSEGRPLGGDKPFDLAMRSIMEINSPTKRQRATLNALRSCRLETTQPAMDRQHHRMIRSGFHFHCSFPGANIYSTPTRMAVVTMTHVFTLLRPSEGHPIPIAGIYSMGNWRLRR